MAMAEVMGGNLWVFIPVVIVLTEVVISLIVPTTVTGPRSSGPPPI